MSYYQLNKKEILMKSKEKLFQKNVVEFHLMNKEAAKKQLKYENMKNEEK